MSEKYKVRNHQTPHFCTTTIVDWIDVFSRKVFKDIIIDSFSFCQEKKGLVLHAYCIMSNHVHFVPSVKEGYMLNTCVRDFKRHTSREIIQTIQEIDESRRKWMLDRFSKACRRLKRGTNFKVWQDGFHPVELNTNKMLDERVGYVHNYPVKAGYVSRPEYYWYSSAAQYLGDEGLIDIERVDLRTH